jgi:hypothetical protein
MAGASRQQGDALLNLFYPDHDNFWLGLLPGVPAVLAFLVSGHRQRLPVSGRDALAAGAIAVLLLLWQPLLWLSGESPSMLTIALLVADICPLVAVNQPSPRACFQEDQINGTFCRSCTPTCVELTRKDRFMKSLRLLLCALAGINRLLHDERS